MFQVDESDYAAIVAQVRSTVFNEELDRRAAELREQLAAKEEAARARTEKAFESRMADKELELGKLRTELTRLEGIIAGSDATRRSELAALETRKDREHFDDLRDRDRRIAELEQTVAGKDSELRVAVMEARNAGEAAVQRKQEEIVRLQADLRAQHLAAENRENQLREQHALQLRDRQAEIDRLTEEIKENTDTMQYYRKLNAELSVNPEALERIVREQYHMQRPGEDVYVFE